MPTEEELRKAKQEWEWQNQVKAAPGAMLGLAQDKPATPHPREIILQDINDQEQRLLDKLHALREIRLEVCTLPREDAERLLKITRLTQRLIY